MPPSIFHNEQSASHAVSDARYPFIRYGNGFEELYDLEADPDEFTNRVGDSAHSGGPVTFKVTFGGAKDIWTHSRTLGPGNIVVAGGGRDRGLTRKGPNIISRGVMIVGTETPGGSPVDHMIPENTHPIELMPHPQSADTDSKKPIRLTGRLIPLTLLSAFAAGALVVPLRGEPAESRRLGMDRTDWLPVMVGGGAMLRPPDTPAAHIDRNVKSSPYAGVVSINTGLSGVLISRTHILTAAHGVDQDGDGKQELGTEIVRVQFNHDNPDCTNEGMVVIAAKEVHLHPDEFEDGPGLGNDVEAIVSPGDSGGPSFLWSDANADGKVDQGELIVFGINTTIGGTVNGYTPFGSFGAGALLSGYRDWILKIVEAGLLNIVEACNPAPQSVLPPANEEGEGAGK